MLALDVVGEDLQRRLRVDQRLLREEQVLVRLHGVGLLRVRPHDDLAVEDPARLSVQDALVELAARAVRLGVVDHGVVVEVLRAGPEEEAVQRASAPSASSRTFRSLRARAPPSEIECEVKLLSRPWLTSVVATWKAASLSRSSLERSRTAPSPRTTSVTALVKYSVPAVPTYVSTIRGLAARLRDHEVAGMGDRGAEGRLRQKDEVDRVRDDGPRRDPDERAVFEERRVHGGEGVAVTRDLREMRLR